MSTKTTNLLDFTGKVILQGKESFSDGVQFTDALDFTDEASLASHVFKGIGEWFKEEAETATFETTEEAFNIGLYGHLRSMGLNEMQSGLFLSLAKSGYYGFAASMQKKSDHPDVLAPIKKKQVA